MCPLESPNPEPGAVEEHLAGVFFFSFSLLCMFWVDEGETEAPEAGGNLDIGGERPGLGFKTLDLLVVTRVPNPSCPGPA